MPGYIKKALHRFAIVKPSQPVNTPRKYIPPIYGGKTQLPVIEDTTALVSGDRAKRIQVIVGVLLYYDRALDHTHLEAVNRVGSMQSKPTEAPGARVVNGAAPFKMVLAGQTENPKKE